MSKNQDQIACCPFCGATAWVRHVFGGFRAVCRAKARCGATGPIRGSAKGAASAWSQVPA